MFEVGELLGHGRVERNHGAGTVGFGTYGAEFESVTGEGKGRRTVAVGVVYEQFGYLRYVELHAVLAHQDAHVLV